MEQDQSFSLKTGANHESRKEQRGGGLWDNDKTTDIVLSTSQREGVEKVSGNMG